MENFSPERVPGPMWLSWDSTIKSGYALGTWVPRQEDTPCFQIGPILCFLIRNLLFPLQIYLGYFFILSFLQHIFHFLCFSWEKKWFLFHNIMVNIFKCIVNTFKSFSLFSRIWNTYTQRTVNCDHIYPQISLNNMTPPNFFFFF